MTNILFIIKPAYTLLKLKKYYVYSKYYTTFVQYAQNDVVLGEWRGEKREEGNYFSAFAQNDAILDML